MNNMKKWNKLNYIQLINDNWIWKIWVFYFFSFRIFVLKISSLRRESTDSPGEMDNFCQTRRITRAKFDACPGIAKNSKFPGATPIFSRATITFWANSRATGHFSTKREMVKQLKRNQSPISDIVKWQSKVFQWFYWVCLMKPNLKWNQEYILDRWEEQLDIVQTMEGIFQNGMTIAEAKPYGDVVDFNGKNIWSLLCIQW